MEKMHYIVISVLAKDQPGIVANISAEICDLGGNLADLRESVLCGYFSMIFISGFPSSTSLQQIRKRLAKVSGAKILVEEFKGSLQHDEVIEDAYVLTAVGKDRAGLVAQISGFCSEQKVNIIDFASHVDKDQYTMMLKIDVAPIKQLDLFRKELIQFGEQSGLNIALQHNDIFRATNEI